MPDLNPVLLAIDAMSGDHGLVVAVDAALQVLSQAPALRLVLVGDEPQLAAALKARKPSAEISRRISLQHASEVVSMKESPSKALRNKKDSSMRAAISPLGSRASSSG
jgi:glycerol-3-phosphate acyltransferase PlsX